MKRAMGNAVVNGMCVNNNRFCLLLVFCALLLAVVAGHCVGEKRMHSEIPRCFHIELECGVCGGDSFPCSAASLSVPSQQRP